MPNEYNIEDTRHIVEKYLPEADDDNATDALDLGSEAGAAEPALFECRSKVPALPNHQDPTKIITLTVEDSANGEDFLTLSPLIQCRIPGVASTGSAAKEFRFRLPTTVRRYVRLAQVVPSGAGDNTGALVTFQLLFGGR